MRSCSQFCLRRTWSKLERLLGCLTSCQLGIDLISHVPFIKGHLAMTLSIVTL
ncbi:hypothetical protein MTR_0125s0040 [Medicago truncatula]|uniref:Uncharacterized protein n=1 Tax=Medicago truncatula TaxID=3880 RepID=A0A072THF8_MEDTR|nr:hypothetical protein MTR_0125s0040 [Medicago truncatula]